MNHNFLPLLWLVFIGHQATSLWGSELKSDEPVSPELLQMDSSGRTSVENSSITVRTNRNEKFSTQLRDNYPLPAGKALEFSAQVDPIKNDDGSTADIDAGITLGMLSPESNPDHIDSPANKVCLELKEFADRYRFTIILDGQTISFWGRLRSEHGIPNIGTRQPGKSYLLKIVAIPRGDQTGLRFFVEHGDRPLRLFKYDDLEARTEYGEFVTEWRINRSLSEHNYLGLYTRESGRAQQQVETIFSDIKVRTLSVENAEKWMNAEEFVMANLNYDHPTMAEVKAARDAGDMEQAKALLIDYFRTRKSPTGPEYDHEMARATAHGKEANWREVSDNAIDGIYAKLSWFHGFSKPGELSRDNGLPPLGA